MDRYHIISSIIVGDLLKLDDLDNKLYNYLTNIFADNNYLTLLDSKYIEFIYSFLGSFKEPQINKYFKDCKNDKLLSNKICEICKKYDYLNNNICLNMKKFKDYKLFVDIIDSNHYPEYINGVENNYVDKYCKECNIYINIIIKFIKIICLIL